MAKASTSAAKGKGKAKAESVSSTQPDAGDTAMVEDREEEECPLCADLAEEERRKKLDPGNSKSKKLVWLGCDKCQTWFHHVCLEVDFKPNDIAKWYCPDCMAKSRTTPGEEPLEHVFKQRKSSRKKQAVNYNPKASSQGPFVPPWYSIAESRALLKNAFPPMTAEQLTLDWLNNDPTAFTQPIFIPVSEGLDMKVLPQDMKISEIAEKVGRDYPLEVIDVASQESLSSWTMGRWADYYENGEREKVRNVISLELSETPLRDSVVSPRIVREIDWVEKYWPAHMKGKYVYPQVTRYCLMSPGQSWTDWHIDFSASSVYYHILRGSKVFYFIEPTSRNLRMYEAWSKSREKQQAVWLGDMCDNVYKVELQPGNTMIIPSGWIHAVYTPADALVIGGNFLHSYNIAMQLRVYQIELNTKVPRKFRFPHFVPLLWYIGLHYQETLQRQKIAQAIQGPQSNGDAKPVPLRVLRGLKSLSAFLIEQAYRTSEGAQCTADTAKTATENINWELIPEPDKLADSLHALVYEALGEKRPHISLETRPVFDAQEFLDDYDPAAIEEEAKEAAAAAAKPKTNGANGTAGGNKRKNTSAASAGQGTKRAKSQSGGAVAGQKAVPPLATVNGKGQEHVERMTVQPVQTIRHETRERPDYTDPTQRQLQTAEIKFTTAENLIKKTIPGEEAGSWVIETRRVVTTIERAYFAPLPQVSSSQETQGLVAVVPPTSSMQPTGGQEDMQDERMDEEHSNGKATVSQTSLAPPLTNGQALQTGQGPDTSIDRQGLEETALSALMSISPKVEAQATAEPTPSSASNPSSASQGPPSVPAPQAKAEAYGLAQPNPAPHIPFAEIGRMIDAAQFSSATLPNPPSQS